MTNAIETTTELDETVESAERVAKVNHEVATKLAETFDESADVFKRARILSTGMKRGATLAEVAALTTWERVRRAFPGLPESDIDAIVADEKRVRKLKLGVSKSSVQAYVSTWNAVVDAAITPTRETVAAMFRAKSTGGTADLIKSAVAAAQESPREGREDVLISVLADGLKSLEAVKKSTGRPNEGDSDETGDGEVGFSLEGAVHTLKAIFAQEWADDERAILAATVAELVGETVDA